MYLELLKLLIEDADLPRRERGGKVAALRGTIESSRLRYRFTRMLLPAFDAAFDSTDRFIARLRVTEVALAVERYRLEHGRLPATLNALVPDYLEAVPEDPLSDPVTPLRLRVSDDGDAAVIYSVGTDGRDDGGREMDEAGHREQVGTDTTFDLGPAQQRLFPPHEAGDVDAGE